MADAAHQVLSRKYRPQAFRDLVGQEHVGRVLKNALTSGRVGHAYLLVGPRGVGKTTIARIFAKAVNCSERAPTESEPCGRCPSCLDITAGSDLDVTEIDGASNNKVEDVRDLREKVGYAAARSRFRIWIVDEVHMLSLPAFNAFLKTLEEPPERVKFLFCTTEEHRLPETFRSRCQRVEFRPIAETTIAARLLDLARREGADLEEGVAEDIARGALGGLRDAESLLEQLVASAAPGPDGGRGRVTRADLEILSGRAPSVLLAALADAVDRGDAAAALDAIDACLASGAQPGVVLDQWLDAWRVRLLDAARAKAGSLARAARSIDLLLEKRQHLRAGAEGPLVLQVAAVELARLPDARDLDELVAALRASPSPAPPISGPPASPPPSSPSPRPPAASPPRAAPPPPAPSPDVGAVAARWPDVVERVGREDSRLAEALRRVKPTGFTDGDRVILLDLPGESGDTQWRSTIERREAVILFRRAAKDVLGRELALRIAAGSAPSGAAASSPPGPSPRAPSQEGTRPGRAGPDRTRPPAGPSRTSMREHPAVRRVTEATEGTLLDVVPSSPEPERGTDDRKVDDRKAGERAPGPDRGAPASE